MSGKIQNVMKRRMLCWYESSKIFSGIIEMPIREILGIRNLKIPSLTLDVINVEVLITSSENALCGKLRKVKERQENQEDH